MDGLIFALLITFTICFVIGFGGCYFKTQNQSILEETERLIRRTNDLSMTYINDYYKSNKPEPHEIGYDDCSNALLKMWMDNVLTDGEYYRIADKLNEKWGKTVLPESYKGVTT